MEKRNYQPSLLWALAEQWYINQLDSPPIGGGYRQHELTLYVYRTDTNGAYMMSGPKMYWQNTPMTGDHCQSIDQDDMAEHADEVGEVVMWDRRLRKTVVIEKSFSEAWRKISKSYPNYPTLDECNEYIRTGLSDKTLTENDRHIIGSLWAYIEQKIGIEAE